MLSCLQDYYQSWEGLCETTEERSLRVGDEAYDCEKDGKATGQGSIVYIGRLSIHFRQHGVHGMGMGLHCFGVIGAACVRSWHSRRSEVLVAQTGLSHKLRCFITSTKMNDAQS